MKTIIYLIIIAFFTVWSVIYIYFILRNEAKEKKLNVVFYVCITLIFLVLLMITAVRILK